MAFALRCELNRLYSARRCIRSLRFCSTEKKGLVLGVYSDEEACGVTLTKSAALYNQATQGKLLQHIQLAGNKVKPGKSFVFWGLDSNYDSVAVVGLGKQNKEFDELEGICENREAVRTAASAGCKALQAAGIKRICVESLEDPESAAEGSTLGTWLFQEYKTKKEPLPEIQLYDTDQATKDCWNRGLIKAQAQNVARKLADTPANLLTPTIFAQEVQNILASDKIKINVYDKEWAKKQKMNAFLAVAQGSVEAPKFVEIIYKNGNNPNPFVLVGKGVTFDAGGISLKPASNMDQMRADMGGAASVIGTLYALSKLNVAANVTALIPLVENLPSGSAIKPGDVITARNGKTICVDNTDAEGRLILADALDYSATHNPHFVLDIATLTGAMSVALGSSATGVFSNSDSLFACLQQAGAYTGDRMWRFPLWKHYTKQMTDNAAYDLNNISRTKGGGACTAAAFLREFVPEKVDWLHLDMAGVMGPDPNSSTPYLGKGMTGRPTRTLVQFIESLL